MMINPQPRPPPPKRLGVSVSSQQPQRFDMAAWDAFNMGRDEDLRDLYDAQKCSNKSSR